MAGRLVPFAVTSYLENELDAQPTPNSELMPDANVVGGEVLNLSGPPRRQEVTG